MAYTLYSTSNRETFQEEDISWPKGWKQPVKSYSLAQRGNRSGDGLWNAGGDSVAIGQPPDSMWDKGGKSALGQKVLVRGKNLALVPQAAGR